MIKIIGAIAIQCFFLLVFILIITETIILGTKKETGQHVILTPTPQTQLTLSPTSHITPPPSLQKNQSATPSSIHIATVTPALTPRSTSIITQATEDTSLTLSLKLPGIGIDGNISPKHSQRQVILTLYNTATHKKIQQRDTLTFNGNTFSDTANIGHLPNGTYQIFVKINGYLQMKLIQSTGTDTFTFANGAKLLLPVYTLLPGDLMPQINATMYGDNILNISDYDFLLSCSGNISITESCAKRTIADLDDNGFINEVDYTLLVHSFEQTTQGDMIPGQ